MLLCFLVCSFIVLFIDVDIALTVQLELANLSVQLAITGNRMELSIGCRHPNKFLVVILYDNINSYWLPSTVKARSNKKHNADHVAL